MRGLLPIKPPEQRPRRLRRGAGSRWGGAQNDVEAVVLDPSFRDTSVEEDLRAAAERYGFSLTWHTGSQLHVDEVPDDFRGPAMPALARAVARPDGVVDAHAIGVRAARLPFAEPTETGDPHESDLQQLKYLWHTVLAHGHDCELA